MTTTLGNISGLNTDTNKVINYMLGKRTAKQIVGEYFGLREEVVYADDGEEVIDYISDFKDIEALTLKKVQYNDKFKEMGITEEVFKKLFPKLPDPKDFKLKITKEDGKTNGGEQVDTGNIRKTKKK